MAHRLTLLLSSPRVAPGLLSRDAWAALGSAQTVLARDLGDPLVEALLASGVEVAAVAALDVLEAAALARLLAERATVGEVVWVGSPDADPGLTDALAAEVSRRAEPPEVEVLVGSFDVEGARLLDLVAVMDRLRSPGGCPWDAAQTPETLAPYLLEEAHEALEAIESGDRDHVVEELGDVLLQVVFHARVGQERVADPFDIDEVAAGIVDKLVRRHPHVFADASASTPSEVEAGWERIKAAEKPGRSSVLAGIPAGLPALARADKVLGRLERAGRDDVLGRYLAGAFSAADADHAEGAGVEDSDLGSAADALGARLLRLVAEAREQGLDAEATLRAILRRLEVEAR